MYCKNCGAKLEENSKFCPECGEATSEISIVAENFQSNDPTLPNITNGKPIKTKKKKGCLPFIIIAFVLFLVLCVILGTTMSNDNNSNAQQNDAVVLMIENAAEVDNAVATEIKDILSSCKFSEITKVEHDDMLDDMDFDGEKGYRITTKNENNVILYLNPDNSIYMIRYCDVVFYENGTVKNTIDSYYESLYITMDEYNQIQTGMTYDEVVAIVGSPGEVISTSTVAGYTVTMVAWYGDSYSGANANVTFSNGEVTAKAQIGLKKESPVAKEETTTAIETTTASETKTTKHQTTTKETTYQNYSSVTTTRPSIQREDEAVLDSDKEYDVFYDGEDYYYVERKTETSTQVIVVVETSLIPIEPWQDENNQQDIDGFVNSYEGEFD